MLLQHMSCKGNRWRHIGGESERSDVDRNVYPPGWDNKRVQELIAYYDQQTEDEIAADLEAAFDAQEAGDQASAAAYRDAINDGLRDLPAGILAEIADFVYFVRKRSMGLKDQDEALVQALAKARVK